jgi:enediyne biosynthesis protein E4
LRYSIRQSSIRQSNIHFPWRHGLLLMLAGMVGCNPPNQESATQAMKEPGRQSRDPAEAGQARQVDSQDSLGGSSFRFSEIPNALPGSEFRDGSESGLFSLLETTGGGVAIFDMDCDGRCDILCSGGGRADLDRKTMRGHQGAFYRGVDAFQFSECTERACIDLSRSFHSALIAADYNNDGFTDILVTGYDSLQLLRNMGDGTFAWVDAFGETLWSSGAAFLDADQDGDLDVYVTHYANWSFDNNPYCPSQADPTQRDYCGPTDFLGLRDSVYENLGDGRFADRSESVLGELALRGLGVLAADLDGDRDVDLYVANDVDPNLLYRNDGDWQFTEIGRRAGVASNDRGKAEGSMGIALGDFNSDGKFDLWVTNYEDEIGALYRNDRSGSFTYASHLARIAATDNAYVGWGTALVDLDLDGDEDILVSNGHLERYAEAFLQPPQVLENHLGKYFLLASVPGPYFQTPQAGRGMAVADLDGDGRVDFCMTRVNAPHAVVRNATEVQGSYLSLKLIGKVTNRDAIGAVVELTAGDHRLVRQVVGGGSYASTSARELHFGIPNAWNVTSGTATIRWPSGADQSIEIQRWNQSLIAVEAE